MKGALCYQTFESSKEVSINSNKFSKGLYSIQIFNTNLSYSQKVIID
jgi:hypothetical protein